MKIITQEEYEAMGLKKSARENPVAASVRQLKVDEHLFVPLNEWTKQTPIGSYISTMNASHKPREGIARKYKTETLLDGSGWIVTREI